MHASVNFLFVSIFGDVYINTYSYVHRYGALPILQVMCYKIKFSSCI